MEQRGGRPARHGGVGVGRAGGNAVDAAIAVAFALAVTDDALNDFVRGGDTEARVGPVRVTPAGLLPPATARRAQKPLGRAKPQAERQSEILDAIKLTAAQAVVKAGTKSILA